MKRSEFEVIKVILSEESAITSLLIEADCSSCTGAPEIDIIIPWPPVKEQIITPFKLEIKNTLLDGNNLIDVYAEAMIYIHDVAHDFDLSGEGKEVERDQFKEALWNAFWEAAEEAIVEPEHFDEEQ